MAKSNHSGGRSPDHKPGRLLGQSSNHHNNSSNNHSHRYRDDEGDDDDNHSSASSVDSARVDRLTRDRHRDLETQPLLSPDDPRVSPLNVRKVKVLKFFLHLLLFVNLIWLILSLISYFVSIPGFDSHGKSFLEFTFVFIGLYVNFLSYAFFLVPSDLRIDWYVNWVSFGFLAFDLFVILVIPGQRRQFGFSEYLTLLFAMFSIGLNLASNRFVLHAKHQEEVRLTGRIETRKTFIEHLLIGTEFALKFLLVLYVVAISLNIFLRSIDAWVDRPWGKLVPAGDDQYSIHLYCQGDVYKKEEDGAIENSQQFANASSSEEQPTIIIDSGNESSEEFVSWVQELYQLNKIHKYCLYDRPGYGFSDSSPSPYSVGINADILSSVLQREKIAGPYLVVGHGVGGLYGRMFATRHISDIHSVLLVDAWSEELLLVNPFKHAKNKDTKLPRQIKKLNRRHGFKLWLEGVLSLANLVTYYNLIVHRYRSSERIYGRDMRLLGKYLRVKLQEQVAAGLLSYNDLQLTNGVLNDADKQVSVLSSKFSIRQSLNWGNWQRELTKLLRNVHNEWVLADAGHRVWEYADGKRQLQKLLLRMVGEDDRLDKLVEEAA